MKLSRCVENSIVYWTDTYEDVLSKEFDRNSFFSWRDQVRSKQSNGTFEGQEEERFDAKDDQDARQLYCLLKQFI